MVVNDTGFSWLEFVSRVTVNDIPDVKCSRDMYIKECLHSKYQSHYKMKLCHSADWKETEKWLNGIKVSFCHLSRPFSWLNCRTSSCAWSIFGLLDNQVAEMKLSPIIGKTYTTHIHYLEKWVLLHFFSTFNQIFNQF